MFCPHCNIELQGAPNKCPVCHGDMKPIITGDNLDSMKRACQITGIVGAIGLPVLAAMLSLGFSWWSVIIGGVLGYIAPYWLATLAPREKL